MLTTTTHVSNLKNYVLDEAANSSNDSSSDLALSQSKSWDNDNKLLGPIFWLWCDCLTINNDFVKLATNFSIVEFCVLYFQTLDIIQSKWNVGSGRQNPTHLMDALLMMLMQLKWGRPYAYMSRVLGVVWIVFCLVGTFILACADVFADYFITQPSMEHYQAVGPVFDKLPNAIEAIDITFQHSYAWGEEYATKKSGGQEITKNMGGNLKLLLVQMARLCMFCLLIPVLFTTWRYTKRTWTSILLV